MATSYQPKTEAASGDPQIQQLKSKAEETVGAVARSTQETAINAYEATSRFVREQPLLALGLATGFAFAIGALWKLSTPHNRHRWADRISDYLEPQYRALRRRL